MRTESVIGILLSIVVIYSLLTSVALPILGWIFPTSASSEAQIWTEGNNSASTTSYSNAKLEGFDKTEGKWSSGSLSGWEELDWVPYRIGFKDLPEGYSSYIFKVYHNNLLDNEDGVDRLRDFHAADEDGNPVAGSVTVSGPYYNTPGKGCDRDIYYALSVRFRAASPGLTWYVYWQAHLAFGASKWPGSSLHAYTDISGTRGKNQDIGINVPPDPTGSISGSEWNDLNRNGVWDLDELGLSEWTIQLYSFDSVESTWIHLVDENTDAAGVHTFSRLVKGNYCLAEIIQDNWIQTYPSAGIHSVALSEGENRSGLDFGNSLAVRHVVVSISPSYQSAQPSTTLNYTVTVTNTGDVVDNYALSASDNAGWGASVSPESLILFPGASDNATLSVTVPEHAVSCTEDNIRVIVTSQADNTVSDFDTCVAHAKEVRREVEVSISPSYQSAPAGTTLSYTVIVRNTGNITDNYALTVSDDFNWDLSLFENRFEDVAPDQDRTAMLNVTIPETAVPSTEDNITVIATSRGDSGVSDDDSCIAHAFLPKADFSLVTLYKVALDLNLWIDNGSKLVVKFYTWTSAYQGENIVWSGATPAHVTMLEDVSHPENKAVETAMLVLTTDNAENVISTVATFTVTRDSLAGRLVDINLEWPFASLEERAVMNSEVLDKYLQWPFAPY